MGTQDCLDTIPAPDAVRQLLAKNLQEARVLRQLLRLAEQRRKLAERADQAKREGQPR